MVRFLLNHTPKLIGAMFCYAGIYKLMYPGQATMALVAVDVPYGLSNAIVLVVTMIELYLAVLLTLQIDLKYAMAVSMAIMLGFTIYLWYLSMLANPPSCGCLGLTGIFKTNKREALFGVFRNCVILWALKLSYDYHFKPPANIEAKAE